MSRDYGKVHTSFWSSETIKGLSDDGRLLALYLMTSPHTNIVGAFRLPDGYASEDMGWTVGRVAKGFAELFRVGFANRCETTKWVWITKHLQWNPPENPNQIKAAAKCAAQVPAEVGWKRAFMRAHGPLLGFGDAFEDNPCETLSQPLLNQEQEQEQEQEKKARKRATPLVVGPEVLIAAGFDPLTAAEFIAHKADRKAPLTERAWADHCREAERANWSPLAAAVKVMAKSWRGFEAKYVEAERRGNGFPARPDVGSTVAHNPQVEATQRLLREQAEQTARATAPPAHILALRSRSAA